MNKFSTQSGYYESYDKAMNYVREKEGAYMPNHFIRVNAQPMGLIDSEKMFLEIKSKDSYSPEYAYGFPIISTNNPIVAKFDLGSVEINFAQHDSINTKTFNTTLIHELVGIVVEKYCVEKDLVLVNQRVDCFHPTNVENMKLRQMPRIYNPSIKDRWRTYINGNIEFFDTEQEAIDYIDKVLTYFSMTQQLQSNVNIEFFPSDENQPNKILFYAPDKASYNVTIQAFPRNDENAKNDSWTFYYE